MYDNRIKSDNDSHTKQIEIIGKMSKIQQSTIIITEKKKQKWFKHIKRMDNNCRILDLVQAFSYVENNDFNLFLQLADPLTCMKIA